jgi:hypothetical protein
MPQALVELLLDRGHFAKIITGDADHVLTILKKNAESLYACSCFAALDPPIECHVHVPPRNPC